MCFALRFYTLYEQVFKYGTTSFITLPLGFEKSNKFWHWTLGIGGKKTFKQGEQMKKKKKLYKTFFATAILDQFLA